MRIPVRLPNNIDPRLSLRGEIARLQERWFWTPDGLQEVAETGLRAISSPTLGFSVEFSLYGTIPSDGTIVAQNISDNVNFREFQIFTQYSTGGINVVIGGVVTRTYYSPQPGNYRVNYDGTRLEIIVNGTEVYSQVVAAGGDTESAATFTIGGRHDGSSDTYGFHYDGTIANVRITDNGTPKHFWRLDRADNLIEDKLNPAGADVLSTINAFSEVNSGLSSAVIENGVVTLVANGTTSYPSAVVFGAITTGDEYVVDVEIDCTNSSTRAFVVLGDAGILKDRLVGVARSVVNLKGVRVASESAIRFYVDNGSPQNGDEVVFKISVRKTNGWGEIKNPSANNKIKMREIEPRGDLRGDEQLPAIMAHELNWQASANAVITIEGETVTLTNTENSEAHAFVTIDSIPGMEYEILIPDHTHGLPAWTANSWSNSRSGFSGLTNPFLAAATGSSAQFRIGTNQGVAGASVSFKGPVSVRPAMRVAK